MTSILGTRLARGGLERGPDTGISLPRSPPTFGCEAGHGPRIVSRRTPVAIRAPRCHRVSECDDHLTDGGSRGHGHGVDALLALRPRLRRPISRASATGFDGPPPGDRVAAAVRRSSRSL